MIHPDDLKRGDWSQRSGLVGALQRGIPAMRENSTTFSGCRHGTATAVETDRGAGRVGRILIVAVVTGALAAFSTVLALDEVASQVTTPAPAAAACQVSPVPFGGEV